ncbi:ABC transporter ATP-binding protein [Citroniella saccharovorans]|uniref:ABC transporter ATP-binding protein n=1 Tax=Citroniella saccharovorans TaxID=2053367 RepID=UPI00360FA504
MSILRVRNINKTYRSSKVEVRALRDVNLDIKKGEFVSIVGPSGSGKSTLLKIIGGIERPDTGYVFIDGLNIQKLSEDNLAIFRRRKIGFVFQFFNLVPVLSVRENILLPILLDNRKVDEAFFKKLVGELNLSDRLDFLPSELSGGGMQRTALARALISKPSIILADEPTGNLDTAMSREIVNLLKLSSRAYDQTIILITHSYEVAKASDRTINLRDGVIYE